MSNNRETLCLVVSGDEEGSHPEGAEGHAGSHPLRLCQAGPQAELDRRGEVGRGAGGERGRMARVAIGTTF